MSFLASLKTTARAAAKPAAVAIAATGFGLAGLAGTAVADDQPGYYVGIGLGYNMPTDSDIKGNNFEYGAEYADDFPSAGLFSVGYDYESPLRGEIELGMRGNGIDDISGLGGSGDVELFTVMGNVLYDIEGLVPGITPYLGGGLGFASIDLDDVTPINGNTVSDSDIVFAGQLIAGASARIAEDLDLTGQYNFLMTKQGEYQLPNGQGFDMEYETHTFTVGLRFNFPEPKPAPEPAPEPAAAPEPAPEPAPAPEPEPEPEPEIVRNFIVFFDWDSAVVTPEAMDVLRQAVGYARTGNVARIVLTGHADTSGASSYNMSLSQRRADAVRTEVVGLGYDGAIDTMARGETEPLVETGDGVREPQNRRVEIMLN